MNGPARDHVLFVWDDTGSCFHCEPDGLDGLEAAVLRLIEDDQPYDPRAGRDSLVRLTTRNGDGLTMLASTIKQWKVQGRARETVAFLDTGHDPCIPLRSRLRPHLLRLLGLGRILND